MFLTVLILLLPCLGHSTKAMDDYLDSYDSNLRLWVYGYQNEGNAGFVRRCCRIRTPTGCRPCKYNVILRSRQTDPNFFSITNVFYNVGTFSRESDMLFETFFFEKLYSWLNVYDYDVNYYVTDVQTRPIDVYEKFQYTYYGSYEFDGVAGFNNIVKSWYVITLDKINYRTVSMLNVIIQSVFFENYKMATGECCFPTPDDTVEETECPFACPFSATIYTGSSDSTRSRFFAGRNSTRLYTYNISLTDNIPFSLVIQRTLRVRILAEKDVEIDRIEIPNALFYRNRNYIYQNVLGIRGNVRVNLSAYVYCSGVSGLYCQVFCDPMRSVETCDTPNGVPVCLNGATDRRKCENFTLTCSNNVCRNNGTCKMTNNNLICSCPSGYAGKYCERNECTQNCNNRGICIGPNRCICNHPFFGPNCELEQCSPDVSKICRNNASCYFQDSSPRCNCDNVPYTGQFCEIPLCAGTCLNGVCAEFGLQHKCLCYDGFEGDVCELKSSKIFINQHNLLVPTLAGLAAVSALMILIIIMKYFNMFCFNVTKAQILQHQDD